MKFQTKFVVTLLLLLMSIPAGMLVLATPPASQAEKPQLNVTTAESKGTHGQMTMLIADEVRHRLLMLSNYGIFDWMECEIKPDNSVTLYGQVTRPTLKADAEAALRKIESISQINNQIEVLPISPSDDQIRIAVYRAIFRYESPLFRYATQSTQPIHIIVNNGRVTLNGVVDSPADSQLASMAANGVSGVFEVKNELVTRRS